MDSFVLPVTNPIISEGLKSLTEDQKKEYLRPAPGTYGRNLPVPAEQMQAGSKWIPIIPLCTDVVKAEVLRPERAKLKSQDLDEIVKLIMGRLKVLTDRLIDLIPHWWIRWFLRPGQPFIRHFMKGPLTNALIKELGDDYQA
jgi:hypothetical protein